MPIRRRTFLAEPGDQILVSHSAVTVTERFDAFITASGLDAEQVLCDPLCTTPVPVYEKDENGNLKRFSTARPEFMWHPLLWLPKDVGLRYQIPNPEDPTGAPRVESDHEWAIRVALELQASGLYDVETGTWLDVLSMYDFDIDNPVDQATVQAWLDGGDDPILDVIDLSSMFEAEDENWAFLAANELGQVLIPAQWALTAHSLHETLTASLTDELNEEDQRRLLDVVTSLSWEMLSDVPGRPGTKEDTEDVLADIEAAIDDDNVDVGTIAGNLKQLLDDIRRDYSVAVETLEAAGAPRPAGV